MELSHPEKWHVNRGGSEQKILRKVLSGENLIFLRKNRGKHPQRSSATNGHWDVKGLGGTLSSPGGPSNSLDESCSDKTPRHASSDSHGTPWMRLDAPIHSPQPRCIHFKFQVIPFWINHFEFPLPPHCHDARPTQIVPQHPDVLHDLQNALDRSSKLSRIQKHHQIVLATDIVLPIRGNHPLGPHFQQLGQLIPNIRIRIFKISRPQLDGYQFHDIHLDVPVENFSSHSSNSLRQRTIPLSLQYPDQSYDRRHVQQFVDPLFHVRTRHPGLFERRQKRLHESEGLNG